MVNNRKLGKITANLYPQYQLLVACPKIEETEHSLENFCQNTASETSFPEIV